MSGATIETLKNINDSSNFERRVALLGATVFGVGFAPIAPGTFGSVAGVAVFLGLSQLPATLYALTVLALFALGVWAADCVEVIFKKQDDGRIVIDEVVGQLLTLSPLLFCGELSLASWKSWLLLGAGFLLFRALDIAKPGPIRMAERAFSGGLGVMLDDVVAGIFGAGALVLLIWGFRGGLSG